jgi:hypothetical protein
MTDLDALARRLLDYAERLGPGGSQFQNDMRLAADVARAYRMVICGETLSPADAGTDGDTAAKLARMLAGKPRLPS